MLHEPNNIHGTIFDIHRFSLNDGPGIRTTVFLKGCPLDCIWCHNPEAKTFKPQLSFDADKCKDCLACVDACPNSVHSAFDNKHTVSFELCDLNGNCTEACPNEALKIIGNEYNIEEVINIILKDKAYYENSSGGMTISGGEPLTQLRFTKELLIEAKKYDIHTAIETCGYVKPNHLAEVIPFVDLFLFDYKATDPEEHKKYTSANNDMILKNLELLLNNGAEVILRCPLISGINDSKKHLEGIAALGKKYPKIKKIELMPYHDAGRDKAKNIGRINSLHHLENTSENRKQEWIKYLNQLNCTNVEIAT